MSVTFSLFQFYAHRGLTFREVFQRVGEVRSLIPPHVSILAMTATVTTTDQLYIQNLLSMQSPQIFVMSPLKKIFITELKNANL